jgi:hypothetical protein
LKSISVGRGGKGFVEPEIREKRGFSFRGILRRELNKEVLETKLQGVGIDLVEFLLGENPIESRCFLRGDRNVLGHEAQRKFISEFHEERGQSIDGVLHMSGKDEMADEDSFFRQGVAWIRVVQKALLREHLGEGGKGYIRIIMASGKRLRQIAVRIFEVRKIDVHEPFCRLEKVHGLVAGEIEDHREIISFAPQQSDEFKHIREEMIRGHKIDVVDVLPDDHILHFREQPLQLDGFAETFSRDLKVLAVRATERAAGEEHGSGPVSACQRGFLAEVRAHISHLQSTVLSAEPGARLFARLQSVHSAFPGAKKALLEPFVPAFFHEQILIKS